MVSFCQELQESEYYEFIRTYNEDKKNPALIKKKEHYKNFIDYRVKKLAAAIYGCKEVYQSKKKQQKKKSGNNGVSEKVSEEVVDGGNEGMEDTITNLANEDCRDSNLHTNESGGDEENTSMITSLSYATFTVRDIVVVKLGTKRRADHLVLNIPLDSPNLPIISQAIRNERKLQRIMSN